jgi:hypothetical protein
VTDPRRRELTVAVVACAVGAAIALWAVSRPWAAVVVVRPAPLPELRYQLRGRAVVPLVGGLAAVGLAGSVALIATRGIARVALGLLLALSGLGLAGVAVGVLAGGIHPPPGKIIRDTASIYPSLCVIAGLVVAASGVAAVVRGRGWPAMGRRYAGVGSTPTAAAGRAAAQTASPTSATSATESPASATDLAGSTRLDDGAAAAWDALDRGEDPTIGDVDAPPAGRPEIPER